jgi:hypothetical protein
MGGGKITWHHSGHESRGGGVDPISVNRGCADETGVTTPNGGSSRAVEPHWIPIQSCAQPGHQTRGLDLGCAPEHLNASLEY